jgi:N-acetylmuramoyl-L-alanine amidase
VFRPVHLRIIAVLFAGGIPFLGACRSDAAGVSSSDRKTFAAATEILNSVAQSEGDGVPDAVLNRTRCLVVFPANRNQGVMSCLETLNHWTRPDLVRFTGERPREADLLIFVVGRDQANVLRSQGKLVVGGGVPTAPGLLARSKAVITDADLNFATLLYARQGVELKPGLAKGIVRAIDVRPAGATSNADQRLQSALASFFNVITPAGIIIHHTAKLPNSKDLPKNINEIDAYHSQRGFDAVCFGREYHVAYHYLIHPDGRVESGRPDRCQGAHARGYNAFLGISVVGDFSRNARSPQGTPRAVPTAAQQAALIRLIRQLRQQYGIPLQRVMQHSDVAQTECPGAGFPFVKILRASGEEK